MIFKKQISLVVAVVTVLSPALSFAETWTEWANRKADETAKAWESTKRTASEVSEETAKAWDTTKKTASEVSTGTAEAWDTTKTWCEKNKEPLIVLGTALATYLIAKKISDSTSAPPPKYDHIPDSPSVAPYKPFTQTQKHQILEANMARNGGVPKSDLSGVPLTVPKQHTSGYTPPPNEAQIDHIIPRSQGGANSSANAQVLSRQENLIKSDNVTK